jgi:hypothetical protein
MVVPGEVSVQVESEIFDMISAGKLHVVCRQEGVLGVCSGPGLCCVDFRGCLFPLEVNRLKVAVEGEWCQCCGVVW